MLVSFSLAISSAKRRDLQPFSWRHLRRTDFLGLLSPGKNVFILQLSYLFLLLYLGVQDGPRISYGQLSNSAFIFLGNNLERRRLMHNIFGWLKRRGAVYRSPNILGEKSRIALRLWSFAKQNYHKTIHAQWWKMQQAGNFFSQLLIKFELNYE